MTARNTTMGFNEMLESFRHNLEEILDSSNYKKHELSQMIPKDPSTGGGYYHAAAVHNWITGLDTPGINAIKGIAAISGEAYQYTLTPRQILFDIGGPSGDFLLEENIKALREIELNPQRRDALSAYVEGPNAFAAADKIAAANGYSLEYLLFIPLKEWPGFDALAEEDRLMALERIQETQILKEEEMLNRRAERDAMRKKEKEEMKLIEKIKRMSIPEKIKFSTINNDTDAIAINDLLRYAFFSEYAQKYIGTPVTKETKDYVIMDFIDEFDIPKEYMDNVITDISEDGLLCVRAKNGLHETAFSHVNNITFKEAKKLAKALGTPLSMALFGKARGLANIESNLSSLNTALSKFEQKLKDENLPIKPEVNTDYEKLKQFLNNVAGDFENMGLVDLQEYCKKADLSLYKIIFNYI